MIKFVSALALIASMAEKSQAAPAAAEILAYVTAQNAITNLWERTQDCIFTDAATTAHTAGSIVAQNSWGASGDGTLTKHAFVHIPKSG